MDTYVASIDVALPQSSTVVDAASATSADNTDKYRFLQAKGFLTKHRPCYMVTEAAKTQINRVTTEQKELVPTTSDSRVDLYETFSMEVGNMGDRPSSYPPQVLRYHVMSFMPDTIPSADDPAYAKLVLWDLRLKDEVMQWPLHDCGNGEVNATAFEECDYMAATRKNKLNSADPITNPIEDETYIYPTNVEFD